MRVKSARIDIAFSRNRYWKPSFSWFLDLVFQRARKNCSVSLS